VVGFCLWLITSNFLDYLQPVFSQIGLYISPEHRSQGYSKELLAAGEAWADYHGIKLRSIGAAAIGSPDYLDEFYAKRGFHRFQVLYFKNAEIPLRKEE